MEKKSHFTVKELEALKSWHVIQSPSQAKISHLQQDSYSNAILHFQHVASHAYVPQK